MPLAAARRWQTLSAGLFRLGPGTHPAALRAIERRCAGFVPLAVLLGLLATVFEGISIGMLMPLLAEISRPLDKAGLPGYAGRLRQLAESIAPDSPLVPLLVLVLVLVLLKAAAQIANATMIAYVEGTAGDQIRRALADKALTLRYSFFLRHDPARLMSIIETESWRATEAVRAVLVGYAARTAAVLFGLLLVAVEWRLALVVSAGVVLSRVVHRLFQRRLRRLSHAVVETNRVLGEQMIHTVRAVRVIRVFGQERREAATFATMSQAVQRAMFAGDRTTAGSLPTVEVILSVSILFVLFATFWLGIGVPQAATFLVLLYRAQIPVLSASAASLRLAALAGAIGEVAWLLSAEPDDTRAAAAALPADLADRVIRFDRVRFDYPGKADRGAPALDELEIMLPPGVMVALIGASGSGKSTVINLLCGLLEPTAGAIRLGDRALGEFDRAQWRGVIGLAGQDTDLITGTVAQNIGYGVPEADPAAIAAAARLADADAFIERLPEGYATRLGAGGLGLSGGQRQRIGLARAVLRRPEIMVLDEATSAVDAESEQAIMQRLARVRPFGRAIVVSHNRPTLRHCEYGIVLAAGRVIEAGPIEQLRWSRAGAAGQEQGSDAEWTLP